MQEEALLLTKTEAAGRLGIGTTLLGELISSGRLRTVTIGRRRLVPPSALLEFVADLERDEAA